MVRVTPGKMLSAREKIKFIAKVTVATSRDQIQQDLDGGESNGYSDRLFQQFLDRATSTITGRYLAF